jgi:antitoxin MazE
MGRAYISAMRSAIKKIGNSAGVIIPKPLLAQLEIEAGDSVDMVMEEGRLFIAKAKRNPREGWEEASKLIGADGLSEEDLEWLGFDDEVEGEWEW